jgi:hypothetical protein
MSDLIGPGYYQKGEEYTSLFGMGDGDGKRFL